MDVTGKTAYLWGYTRGEGSDLSYARVYSYFYVNGDLIKTDYDNDPSYASIDYDASAIVLHKAKITSSHYVYNRLGENKTKTSMDQWPK
ncbi:hypothetical protein KDJ56_05785 [Brevibacillus composti]|uniref:Uncharacterized protein n=1 Tax=Brevibacillus composti TaxID=2796470 RepID=A0A7T5JPP2_9BACL|nr:hypothetical protein [Brevibacillus composti]QQE75479.1 hypothetical protein JD108_06105 [Brevibacillus composti]QUO42505.1 hypothetical protein KDJ56_05785 [Brevibacillus composti]